MKPVTFSGAICFLDRAWSKNSRGLIFLAFLFNFNSVSSISYPRLTLSGFGYDIVPAKRITCAASKTAGSLFGYIVFIASRTSSNSFRSFIAPTSSHQTWARLCGRVPVITTKEGGVLASLHIAFAASNDPSSSKSAHTKPEDKKFSLPDLFPEGVSE